MFCMPVFAILVRCFDLVSSHLDERSESFVDSGVVTEDFGDVRVDLHKVCAGMEALSVLSSNTTFHLGEVVFWAEVICWCVILLHSLVSPEASLVVR